MPLLPTVNRSVDKQTGPQPCWSGGAFVVGVLQAYSKMSRQLRKLQSLVALYCSVAIFLDKDLKAQILRYSPLSP